MRVVDESSPYIKTLADLDYPFQPSVPRAGTEEFATLRLMDRAEKESESVWLTG